MSRITSLLTSTAPSDQAKIRSWMFPDQDLLSDLFFDKWIKLPWYYNALKTMRYWHGKFFRDEDVRNLHYIVDKPWQRRPQRNDEGMRKETGCVFRVEPGEFGEVNDESGGYTLGLPAHEADAVTHGWWWEEYEEMVVEMRETGYSKWEYLEGLVAN